MSVYREDLLAARFEVLAPVASEGDWLDVQRRARRRSRRRKLALVLAATVAAILVGSSLAFGSRIVDFFVAQPAPTRIVMQFKEARRSMKVHWGASLPVIESEARTVIDIERADGSSAYIAVAPARGGDGFCLVVNAFGERGGGGTSAGCVDGKQRRTEPLRPGGGSGYEPSGEQTSWSDFAGYVADTRTTRLVVHYEDGAEDEVSVIWISKPIDAGFFAFDPAREHEHKGHRASAFIAFDASGAELERLPLSYVDPNDPWLLPRGEGWPPAIDRTTVHAVPIPNLPSWAVVRLGRGRDGGRCFRILGGLGGGCVKPGADPTCCEAVGADGSLIGGRARSGVLFYGLAEQGATVEFRYADGRRDIVRPVEGVVVYAVPGEQYPKGHRLESGVVRDASGTVVQHVHWLPSWGQAYFRHLPTP